MEVGIRGLVRDASREIWLYQCIACGDFSVSLSFALCTISISFRLSKGVYVEREDISGMGMHLLVLCALVLRNLDSAF